MEVVQQALFTHQFKLVELVRVWLPCEPLGQGNLKCFGVGGRHILSYQNGAALKKYRRYIHIGVLQTWNKPAVETPVYVEAVFQLQRGVTVKRTLPTVYPDTDKLQRAIGDALTDAIIIDDAQIVGWQAWKCYGTPGLKLRIFEVRL